MIPQNLVNYLTYQLSTLDIIMHALRKLFFFQIHCVVFCYCTELISRDEALHYGVNICVVYVWLGGRLLNKPAVYWKSFPSRRLDKIKTCLCMSFTHHRIFDRPHRMPPAFLF